MTACKALSVQFIGFDHADSAILKDTHSILVQNYTLNEEHLPAYVFVTGYSFEKYRSDAVLIYVCQNCEYPDFNYYDYAIGSETLSFSDRYFQYTAENRQALASFISHILTQPYHQAFRRVQYGYIKQEKRTLMKKINEYEENNLRL